MARGGSAADDVVNAVIKALNANRGKVDDVARTVRNAPSGVANVIKSVLGKGKKPVKPPKAPKNPPKSGRGTTATMTKDERRLANQRRDAERRQANADKSVAQKAADKKANKEKYAAKERIKVEERYTPTTMRGSGRPLINSALSKKLDSIDYKLRIIKNESGEFDRVVGKIFDQRFASIKADGYVLNKKEVLEMRRSIGKEIMERAERNVDTMSAKVRANMAKYGKMSADDLDIEAGRMLFRSGKKSVRTGDKSPDLRKDFEVRQDKETTMRLEALARKKADAARNKGTGTPTGAKVKGPESEKAREARLSALASERKLVAQQKANEPKIELARQKRNAKFYTTPKKLTAEEYRQTKIIDQAESDAKRFAASKGGEGYSDKAASAPLVERNAFGMTRQEFVKYKAELKKSKSSKKR